MATERKAPNRIASQDPRVQANPAADTTEYDEYRVQSAVTSLQTGSHVGTGGEELPEFERLIFGSTVRVPKGQPLSRELAQQIDIGGLVPAAEWKSRPMAIRDVVMRLRDAADADVQAQIAAGEEARLQAELEASGVVEARAFLGVGGQ